MKKILKIPLRKVPRPTSPPAESLRAKVSANAEAYDAEDYEVEEEPSMKFSHALIVVLALHVIAVGGVFAFNSIKAGQATASTKSPLKEETVPPPAQTSAPKQAPPREEAVAGWSGKTYTVQAGDTLNRIASVYKTNVEAIEKENGITSHSMIRVGQILKIPASNGVAGKSESSKPADPAAVAKHAFLAAKTDAAKTAPTAAKADAGNSQQIAGKPESAKSPAVTAKADNANPPQAPAATPKPANAQASPKKPDSLASPEDADVYTVAKGDNPYSIAKKLHVSYSELLALNEIKDPTRVQIGQKLKIPARKN
jgi:LysM repeat protein